MNELIEDLKAVVENGINPVMAITQCIGEKYEEPLMVLDLANASWLMLKGLRECVERIDEQQGTERPGVGQS